MKNNSQNQGNIKRSVTLTTDDYEKLKRLAASKHCTVADVLREFIAEGFARNDLDENSSAIRVAISQTLQDILPPMLDTVSQKLSGICWRAARNSAAAMYLAESTYELISTDPRGDVLVLADSIRAASDFCHLRASSEEQYIAEAKGFFKGSESNA